MLEGFINQCGSEKLIFHPTPKHHFNISFSRVLGADIKQYQNYQQIEWSENHFNENLIRSPYS